MDRSELKLIAVAINCTGRDTVDNAFWADSPLQRAYTFPKPNSFFKQSGVWGDIDYNTSRARDHTPSTSPAVHVLLPLSLKQVMSRQQCEVYRLHLGTWGHLCSPGHNLLALFSSDFSIRKKSKLFTLYTCNLLLILMKQTTCCCYFEINISLFRLHCTPSSAARACIWKRMKVECSKLRRAGCSKLGCLDKHLKRDGRWIVIKLRRTIWWEGGR